MDSPIATRRKVSFAGSQDGNDHARKLSILSPASPVGSPQAKRSLKTVSGSTIAVGGGKSSAAAGALALLLREDPFLVRHGLTKSLETRKDGGTKREEIKGEEEDLEEGTDRPAFGYAASLLSDDNAAAQSWLLGSGSKEDTASSKAVDIQRRASEAEAEVDRKLALVDSLAERISRERPEEIAGPLLQLHGFDVARIGHIDDDAAEKDSSLPSSASSLVGLRDKCDRLRRKGDVLETMATRVESSLIKSLTRMKLSTTKLSRVLQLSSSLKMIMRLQFEIRKVRGFQIDDEGTADTDTVTSLVDLRELTRAAASVAIMEELLNSPDLSQPMGDTETHIAIVEHMKPEILSVASAVRRAASMLLQEQQQLSASETSIAKLSSTLQVYYHLGELSVAIWDAVLACLRTAQGACHKFFDSPTIHKLLDDAAAEAKVAATSAAESSTFGEGVDDVGTAGSSSVGTSGPTSVTSDKRLLRRKQNEALYQRFYKKKLREKKAQLTSLWSMDVLDASLKVWNLHRVLSRKSDPTTRENFLAVLSRHPVPPEFQEAERLLSQSTPPSGKRRHNVFALYWNQMAIQLGNTIETLLYRNDGSSRQDVATLYPSVRSASLDMILQIQDAMSAAGGIPSSTGGPSPANSIDDSHGSAAGMMPASTVAGILGGSVGLDDAAMGGFGFGAGGNLDGRYAGLELTEGAMSGGLDDDAEAAAAAYRSASADTWTRGGATALAPNTTAADPSSWTSESKKSGPQATATTKSTSPSHLTSTSRIFSSPEWVALQGYGPVGLSPLQRVFVEQSRERLSSPIQYMFPEAVTVDENGVALPVLPTLPSRYDIAKLETAVREELSMADPREGGGELSMTPMLAENVVHMVEQFCAAARSSTSEAVHGGSNNMDASTHEIAATAGKKHRHPQEDDVLYIRPEDGSATEALLHDIKVANVMNTLTTALRNAPESTFIAPYRPAQSPQHEEAASMCQISLMPAVHEIDGFVRASILNPLCRALNAQVSSAIARMHQGTYMEDRVGMEDDGEGASSFVQQHLTPVFEKIASKHLSSLPSEYAGVVAAVVASYSIYAFVSNASLVRPLGEMGRLRITQDLADFELALEQLVFKAAAGGQASLSQVGGGKPYAELRAVRQMLFWNGLNDDGATSAQELAKSMLREAWIKDVRPSTAFHFLFSFAPPLLSSPHHSKRMKPEEYVSHLVTLDASIDEGEASAWMTTLACCDAYRQRESVDQQLGGRRASATGGDRRVASILVILGPELLRRRRQ